ncbi:hypothetical protein Tco_1176985 [Tanacetum coccineum]
MSICASGGHVTDFGLQINKCSVSHIDADVDSFKRCCTSYTFDVRYRSLKGLLLLHSSINNSASFSNKFRGLYFSLKFGISGLHHHVFKTLTEYDVGRLAREFNGLRCDRQFSRDIIVLLNDNGTSHSKQNFQSSSTTFITFQNLCLRQELLEYMSVHDNDASESSKPSWGKRVL